MSQLQPIKLINAALDDNDGEITLRGILSPESLASLKVADYQREILPGAKAKELALAMQAGDQIPDITLGMRGGNYTEHRDRSYHLDDRVFIIDGLQRTTAALNVLAQGGVPRLGATVYFNTTEQTERVKFRQLNTLRNALSPNVLLYNERHSNQQIKLLYDLCQDSTFALYQRVSWKQLMKRTDLINAVSHVRVAGGLHRHFGMTDGHAYKILTMADNLQKLKIPRESVRNNVKEFWELLDKCWRIRDITYKEYSPHIRGAFLTALAALLTRHQDFWEDSVLKVSTPQRKKLAQFKLRDPNVAQLCGAGNTGASMLYTMLIEHINSGKKLYRLREFNELKLKPGPKAVVGMERRLALEEEEEA